MSDLKATPGPWQWFPSVSKERPAAIDTAPGVDSDNGTVIAEVPHGKQYTGNANLITAAPELYAEGVQASLTLREMATVLRGVNRMRCAEICEAAADRFDAVAAKARGQ